MNEEKKSLANVKTDLKMNSEIKLSDKEKAEARAKRKEAKKQNKGSKKETKPTDSQLNDCSAPPEIKENENNAGNIETGKELSKAELRAQRRAVQEAQRQAKAAAKAEKQIVTPAENTSKVVEDKKRIKEIQKSGKLDVAKEFPKLKRISARKDSISIVTGGNFNKQVQLFNHLYFHHSLSITKDQTTVSTLHSSIIKLGVQYMSLTVLGSNARCLALLSAVKNLVEDFQTPPQQEFCRSLEANLQDSTNYLQKCRPLAASMTNAIRHIKWQLTQMPTTFSDKDKKDKLLEAIDTYITDEIGMADQAISITVQAKIYEGDVILTYGCSSVVTKILLDAHKNGKQFKVIVVDARPLLEGREMLRMLVNAKISCSYVLINAASFCMGQVTKVLLGAHSLLANGYVMSRAGTAQVALIAQAFNKPVLVCCETYKFCERVQTDSIVYNEIGDPDKLILSNTFEGESPLSNWKENKHVTPLNLMYDITPPDLVTAVVTELAILPCTSVPVVLRIKPTELITY